MQDFVSIREFFPTIFPLKANGKMTFKIHIKKDFVRMDGTCAIYLNLYQDGKSKKLPLNISVPIRDWDEKKQLVRKSNKNAGDLNLLIGKIKGDLNTILLNYRLSNVVPKLENVVDELTNPSGRTCFNAFWKTEMDEQFLQGAMKASTYRQQKGAWNKIKKFRDPLPFSDIDEKLISELRAYCKKVLGNKSTTIESTMKNFKKYLHLANKKRIRTQVTFDDIKVKSMAGNRVFLLPEEVKLMYNYCFSPFINNEHRMILKRFLFSCFTGIRISDSEKLTEQNFIGDHLALTMLKTDKFIRIKLNQSALSLVEFPEIFKERFTREHINRELKVIARTLGIKKKIHFHTSRHTFATNFLLSGGDVVNLQRLLGHSKIDLTMIYVHIVDSITDRQMELLDSIIK